MQMKANIRIVLRKGTTEERDGERTNTTPAACSVSHSPTSSNDLDSQLRKSRR